VVFQSSARFKSSRYSRGYIVIILTIFILLITYSSIKIVFDSAMYEYQRVKWKADYIRAHFLAQSGLSTAMEFIKKIKQDQLYQFGILNQMIPFQFPGMDGSGTLILTEETGKINVNYIINFFDDNENGDVRHMLDRLSEHLNISPDIWDGVEDWIDENNVALPRGYEEVDYSMMEPPRRIKNGRLHSLEELLLIPGFDNWLLYNDRRSKYEKEAYSKDFATKEDLLVQTDEDYILANNLTYYIPEKADVEGRKININSAPYHVILSLSDFMSPDVAQAVVKERIKNGGYFQSINDLQSITQLLLPSSGGGTILDEIKGQLVFKNRIYKVVVEVSSGLQSARIVGIYDTEAAKLIMYLE